MLRTEVEERAEGRTIRLVCVAVLSLQLAIRSGHSADIAAVTVLLDGAGRPTDDLTSALLRSLVIAPAYRGRGLGHRLVVQLEQEVQDKGVQRMVLLTETGEWFFRKNGYEVIERRYVPAELTQSAEFRSLCPASAVCMAKVLQQPIRRRNSDVGASDKTQDSDSNAQ